MRIPRVPVARLGVAPAGTGYACRLPCVASPVLGKLNGCPTVPDSWACVVVETSPDPFVAVDDSGCVIAWNAAAEILFGWSRQQVVGRPLAAVLVAPAELTDPRDGLTRVSPSRFADLLGVPVEMVVVDRFNKALTLELVVGRVILDGSPSFYAFLRDASARRLAEAELRTNEERLRWLVDGAPEYGIFMLDPDGYIVTWNVGAQRIKGYTEQEALGQHFSIFYTTEARTSGHPQYELTVARATGRYEEEAWRVRKDGSLFWANVVITALRDKDGALRGFSKVTRDLSERQRADLALRASEERLQLLVDGAPEYGIFMLDPDGYIVTWNVGAQRIKGYTEQEALGQHFSIFYTTEARTSGHPQYELTVARATGRYEEEAWRVRKDGSLFWANVVITALRDKDGALRGFSKVTRDLSERRRADLALRASEARFRGAFDDAPTAACIVAPDGTFLQVNEALSRLTGFPLSTLLTMSSRDLTPPADRDADAVAVAGLLTGVQGSYSRSQRYLHADGTILWVNVHAVPIHDSDGQVVALLNHAVDITQQRLHEEQLVELAHHDPLTGLANRTMFFDELDSHLERCRRYGAAGAVLMLDLDHFKAVNDTLGHRAGDEVIQSVATALRSRLRSGDLVARLGGDEFAVLLPEGGREDAELVATAIIAAIRDEEGEVSGSRGHKVTASAGIAVISHGDLSSHDLLAAADAAMYAAKDAGRDRYLLSADVGQRPPRAGAVEVSPAVKSR